MDAITSHPIPGWITSLSRLTHTTGVQLQVFPLVWAMALMGLTGITQGVKHRRGCPGCGFHPGLAGGKHQHTL